MNADNSGHADKSCLPVAKFIVCENKPATKVKNCFLFLGNKEHKEYKVSHKEHDVVPFVVRCVLCVPYILNQPVCLMLL